MEVSREGGKGRKGGRKKGIKWRELVKGEENEGG